VHAGHGYPGGKVFESLVKLGFNANWLLTGEGEMKRGETGGEAGVQACVSPAQGADLAPDMLELARLLDRYGNKALVENVRQRLLKIKQETEG
jgi:hypothetical protein